MATGESHKQTGLVVSVCFTAVRRGVIVTHGDLFHLLRHTGVNASVSADRFRHTGVNASISADRFRHSSQGEGGRERMEGRERKSERGRQRMSAALCGGVEEPPSCRSGEVSSGISPTCVA